MKMILLFTVCMVGDPATCERRELPIWEPISPMACMMGAQLTLAQWRQTHPDWRITRWSCAAPGGERAALD